MRKVILEVRLNEYAPREPNRHIPFLPQEIIDDATACAKAGATAVHFHARKADGGPEGSFSTYREIVEGIRSGSDVLIHPTLGMNSGSSHPHARFQHIADLHAAGIPPDFAPLDMASTNIDRLDPVTGEFLSEENVYVNTTGTLRYFANQARSLGVMPYCVIWNISSLRQTLAFQRIGLLPKPVFAAFVLSGPGRIAGHPATEAGLRAYLEFLPPDASVIWTVLVAGANGLDLLPLVVKLGGHVTIGLGDFAYSEIGQPTNADLVRRAIQAISDADGIVATPAEARQMLG
jgi:uncharacterized protein (DUF849 family)